MLRAITDTLTVHMREQLQASYRSLKAILSIFWAGTVEWSAQANRQLVFWQQVKFETLHAPILADVLGKSAELVVAIPSRFDSGKVSFLCQDASETASGGGMLIAVGDELVPVNPRFLAQFDQNESQNWRELRGIRWCMQAAKRITHRRVVFLCDNLSACLAVAHGSSNPVIQQEAEAIFL